MKTTTAITTVKRDVKLKLHAQINPKDNKHDTDRTEGHCHFI